MTINRPLLVRPEQAILDMRVTDPRHISSAGEPLAPSSGASVSYLQGKTGAGAVLGSGATFEKAMLQALDRVSGLQQEASAIAQAAITDPASMDIHDITTAQAKANMTLNITRTVLSRLVQGWRDLINTR